MRRSVRCATSQVIRAFILSPPMGSPHRVHALPGGARLVTETMPERHSTSVVFMFGGGSRLEDERLAGASHFIEPLFFKGTKRRPSPKEISDAIGAAGLFINAV